MTLLQICIPTYKRPDGAIRAAESVLSQITDANRGKVRVVIFEDHGTASDFDRIREALAGRRFVDLKEQPENKGMSANILDLLSSCTAQYAMLLTDDDWMPSGSLDHILPVLESGLPDIVYGPRYSYTEDDLLHTIATRSFRRTTVFKGTTLNCGRYSTDFFILSGLVLKPALIDYELWKRNIENAFFPVLFGYSVMKSRTCMYLDKEIVHHVVLNVCHWERWGTNMAAQNIRLATDWFSTMRVMAKDQPLPLRPIFMAATVPGRAQHFLVSVVTAARSEPLYRREFLPSYLRIFFGDAVNILALAWSPIHVARVALRKVLTAERWRLRKMPSRG